MIEIILSARFVYKNLEDITDSDIISYCFHLYKQKDIRSFHALEALQVILEYANKNNELRTDFSLIPKQNIEKFELKKTTKE